MSTHLKQKSQFKDVSPLNKSLIANFLKYNKVIPRWYDSLSSKREYQDVTKESRKQYSFTITPNGTDIRINKIIYELSSTSDPRVLEWIEEFRELAISNEWNDKTAIIILKSVINANLKTVFENKLTLDTCLDALIKDKYPLKRKFYYEENISKINQKNYYLIDQYVSDLQDSFKKYCYASQIKPKEQETRLEEYFDRGLCLETKLEIERKT